jgi:uncharacterized protein
MEIFRNGENVGYYQGKYCCNSTYRLRMNLDKIVSDKKDAILEVCAKHGAHNVRVFGSMARGDFDTASDIDLLVRLSGTKLKGIRYFHEFEQLHEELENLLGRNVDVVDESALKEPLPSYVLEEAIPL